MSSNFINKLAVAFYRIPGVKDRWANNFNALESDTIPWTPLKQPLSQCKVALLTTGGVHLKTDPPFNMEDKEGDPTYRKSQELLSIVPIAGVDTS